MRKILTCLLLFTAVACFAQENSASNVEKIMADKSFVFVSTASFGDKSTKSYNPHKIIPISDTHSGRFSDYNGKISIPNQTERMLLVETQPSMANQLPKVDISETPVIYLDKEGVSINPAIIPPTFYELKEANADLTKPLNYSNYSVKKSKSGKTKIRFDVNGSRTKKRVFLSVLPNGQSSLTIVSGGTTNSFKGFIAAI